MDLVQHEKGDARQDTLRVVCGWCGRLLRDRPGSEAATSHGICDRCARVLERVAGDEAPRGEPAFSALEEHTNQLMCHLYETSQMLLDIQQRVRENGELLGRVGQALASVRRQERAVAHIQRWMASAQE